jgi:general nucleoside transport system permease protein
VVLASATGSLTVGVISALLSGLVLAWVLGVLAIRYRVDQIIIGVFINIFALGLTSFLTSRILVNIPDLNNSPRAQPIAIPVLSDIPVLGPVLFDNNIFVYAMFFFVALLQWALFRTRWGLRARSVGEQPKAADTLGINVFRTRYRNVMFGGMMAGLGGAFFTLGSVGRFDENMTAGRGFIGLAAMIFGRYHPVGALGAALVFGFADSLQEAGHPQDPDPLGVPAHGPLHRHHHRRRRRGRPGQDPRRRRPAIRERMMQGSFGLFVVGIRRTPNAERRTPGELWRSAFGVLRSATGS